MGAERERWLMEPAWPLGVGGRLVIDGEAVFVSSVEGAEVRGFTAAGEPVRFVLTRVAEPEPPPERRAARSGGSARCWLTPGR